MYICQDSILRPPEPCHPDWNCCWTGPCCQPASVQPVSAPRKCSSVSVPNWGTFKKTPPLQCPKRKNGHEIEKKSLPPSVSFWDNGHMASWTGSVSASLKGSGTMESMESCFELSILDSTIDLDATAAYLAAKSWDTPKPNKHHHHTSYTSYTPNDGSTVNPPPTSPKDLNSPSGSTSAQMSPEVWNHFQSHFQGAGSEGKPAIPTAMAKPFQNFLVLVGERGRWSSTLPIVFCAAGSQAILPRAGLSGKWTFGNLTYLWKMAHS